MGSVKRRAIGCYQICNAPLTKPSYCDFAGTSAIWLKSQTNIVLPAGAGGCRQPQRRGGATRCRQGAAGQCRPGGRRIGTGHAALVDAECGVADASVESRHRGRHARSRMPGGCREGRRACSECRGGPRTKSTARVGSRQCCIRRRLLAKPRSVECCCQGVKLVFQLDQFHAELRLPLTFS